MYEVFENLLRENKVSSYRVSKETGVTQTALSNWKTGKSTPTAKTLQKIADYFGVTIDYLMTGKESESKEWEPTLTEKDEKDIQKELDNLLNQLDNNTGLMFDGEAMDDETKELLKASLEHAVRTVRITAKKKFTPKKYRK